MTVALPFSSPATVCLTFDNMGSAAAIGRGEASGFGADDIGPAGYPEALALLDKLGLKATFFIEGWNARYNSSAVLEVARRGHEIGIHGWVHEVFHTLAAEDVERILTDSLAAFRAINLEPRGFRAPGGLRGDHTISILKHLGLEFDSSIDHGPGSSLDLAPLPQPHLIGDGVTNVPWQWRMIDYYQYYMRPRGPRTPESLANFYKQKIDMAAQTGRTCTIILHPFVSFKDSSRRRAIEEVLRHAIDDPRIEFRTVGEVAEYTRKRQPGLCG